MKCLPFSKAGRCAFQLWEWDVEGKKDTVTAANPKEDEMSSLSTPSVSISICIYLSPNKSIVYLPTYQSSPSMFYRSCICPSVHPLSIYQLSLIHCHLSYVFCHPHSFLSIKHLLSILYLKKWYICPIKKILKPSLNVLKYILHWIHIGDMRIFTIRTKIGVNPHCVTFNRWIKIQ